MQEIPQEELGNEGANADSGGILIDFVGRDGRHSSCTCQRCASSH